MKHFVYVLIRGEHVFIEYISEIVRYNTILLNSLFKTLNNTSPMYAEGLITKDE